MIRVESRSQMVRAESSKIKEEQDECSANQTNETFTPSTCLPHQHVSGILKNAL
jgi:hypothetical protein